MHELRVAPTPEAATRFLLLSLAAILLLNVLAGVTRGAWDQQALATVILLICLYPVWRYLRGDGQVIPLVPVIAGIYGLYFGLPALLPFEAYVRLADLPHTSIRQAQGLVIAGLLMMFAGSSLLPRGAWRPLVPRLSLRWSEGGARRFAIALGVLGMLAKIVTGAFETPLEFGVVVTLLAQLSLVAIGILFFLQLRGTLPKALTALLWGAIIPGQVIIDVASGFIFPAVRLALLLVMVYMGMRRRVPWKLILVSGAVVVLLTTAKTEFRSLTWDSPQSRGDLIARGLLFFEVAGSSFGTVGWEGVYEGLETLARRVNLLVVFALVVNQTPDPIPYWFGETYVMLAWKALPRMLYPEKPIEEVGQTFGHRYGLLEAGDYKTSVNLPQLVEMYANFGVIGVLVGMFLLGMIYQALNYSLNHPDLGDLGFVVAATILSSLANIESNFSLVYGGLFYLSGVLYCVGWLIRRPGSDGAGRVAAVSARP